MAEIKLRAPAKINLTLDVKSRLKSGYHRVEMILQQIGLADDVEIISGDKQDGIRVKTNHPFVPEDQNNIAYKAAQLIKDTYGIKRQVTVYINKRIPVAAGLGGGSTDAAAVISGLNRVWDLGLDIETMMGLGKQLGADVPFCILGGTALAEGIGETITSVYSVVPLHILLVRPDFMVSTARVYDNLELEAISKRPDNSGMIKALKMGDMEGIAARMCNVLEGVTARKYPEINDIKGDMVKRGALGAVMSGSGPTVVGLFPDCRTIASAAEFFRTKYKEVIVTETVTSKEGD